MKIAIPTANGWLCQHFGHCELFAIVEVDDTTRTITRTIYHVPPPHEPGVLPRWLHEEMEANVIIAGGMGMRAQQLFNEHNIEVIVGAGGGAPEELALAYLNGNLETGANACDH
jgi:ATP-binding protein involved in chromosome partitioning